MSQTKNYVVAHSDGSSVSAKRAIVAISPALAGRIRYNPPLPASRDNLTQRMPMGSVIKCLVAYERPFWFDAGLSGEAITDRVGFGTIFDASPTDRSFGVLSGFFDGADAIYWSTQGANARQQEVIATIARIFGAKGLEPLDYVEQDWLTEEWSRGGYSGNMPPHTLTEVGQALRAPCGLIHWAGTETSNISCGYLDGALHAGERAAQEVLTAIS